MSATYSADNTWGQWGRQYGNVEKVYAYGVAHDDDGTSTGHWWGTGDGHILIGDRAETGSSPWWGEVYTIRIYNRALAAEEIAANYKLDMERFAPHYWGGTDGSFGTAGLWKNSAGETVQSIPGAGNDICIKEGAHEHTDQNISLDTDRTVASLTVTNGNVRAS